MTGRATFCHMPEPCPPQEADIWNKFRDCLMKAHCADKRDAHRCAGVITLDRDSITFQCPRCGDAKQVIKDDA